MVFIGKMLHAQIPAPVVSKIYELADDDVKMLTCNGRYAPIGHPCALHAVAGGTGLKQRLSVHEIGLAAQHPVVLHL